MIDESRQERRQKLGQSRTRMAASDSLGKRWHLPEAEERIALVNS